MKTIPYAMFPRRERSTHLQNLCLEDDRILKNETREDLSGGSWIRINIVKSQFSPKDLHFLV